MPALSHSLPRCLFSVLICWRWSLIVGGRCKAVWISLEMCSVLRSSIRFSRSTLSSTLLCRLICIDPYSPGSFALWHQLDMANPKAGKLKAAGSAKNHSSPVPTRQLSLLTFLLSPGNRSACPCRPGSDKGSPGWPLQSPAPFLVKFPKRLKSTFS